MSMPFVSVIVPIYRTEQYICQCVQSIINQTYQNIEIILVDDGSPDNCGNICEEYAKKDKRIRVIHKDNGGLSDARNAGIEIVTGDYIIFIDSDDYVEPNMVESLMNVVINGHVDIVQCDYMRCHDDGTVIMKQYAHSSPGYSVYTDDKMYTFLKGHIIDVVAWGKIYRASLFREIRFPKGRLHEDVFTTYKLIHEANAVAVTDYVGYVYRINKKSITGSSFSPKKLDSIYGKIEQAKFVDANYKCLCQFAYIGIIYACNNCLLQMSVTDYKDEAVMLWMQKLYRKYGKYYLLGNVSGKGKIVTLASMADIRLGRLICRISQRSTRNE